MTVCRRSVKTSLYVSVVLEALKPHKQAIALAILEELGDPSFDLDARYTEMGPNRWYNLLLDIGSQYPVFLAYWVDAKNRVTVTGLSFGYNPWDDAPQDVFNEYVRRRAERIRRRGGRNGGLKAYLVDAGFFATAPRAMALPTRPSPRERIKKVFAQRVRVRTGVVARKVGMMRIFGDGEPMPSIVVLDLSLMDRRLNDHILEEFDMRKHMIGAAAWFAVSAISNTRDDNHPYGGVGPRDDIDAGIDIRIGADTGDISVGAAYGDTVNAMLNRVWARQDDSGAKSWTDDRVRPYQHHESRAGRRADQIEELFVH